MLYCLAQDNRCNVILVSAANAQSVCLGRDEMSNVISHEMNNDCLVFCVQCYVHYSLRNTV